MLFRSIYSAIVKGEGMPVGGYTHTTSNTKTAAPRGLVNSVYPRMVSIKHAELDSHPIFQMTTEQLRAAWMLNYGSRWVSLGEIQDDDMLLITDRLRALGEMEIHNVVDQYSPMGRLKL